MNKAILTGRITNDLELRYTSNQKEILNINLAVKRDFKNAQGEYDTDFIKVSVFGATAKYLHEHSGKGKRIQVEGRIQVQQYEKNDEKRYDTSIIAEKVEIIDFNGDIYEEFGKKVEADAKREMPF